MNHLNNHQTISFYHTVQYELYNNRVSRITNKELIKLLLEFINKYKVYTIVVSYNVENKLVDYLNITLYTDKFYVSSNYITKAMISNINQYYRDNIYYTLVMNIKLDIIDIISNLASIQIL